MRSSRARSPAPPLTSFRRSPPASTGSSDSRTWWQPPHLGASTSEAQENVAIQIAEQMSDYLLTGAVSNALNMPSISVR